MNISRFIFLRVFFSPTELQVQKQDCGHIMFKQAKFQTWSHIYYSAPSSKNIKRYPFELCGYFCQKTKLLQVEFYSESWVWVTVTRLCVWHSVQLLQLSASGNGNGILSFLLSLCFLSHTPGHHQIIYPLRVLKLAGTFAEILLIWYRQKNTQISWHVHFLPVQKGIWDAAVVERPR